MELQGLAVALGASAVLGPIGIRPVARAICPSDHFAFGVGLVFLLRLSPTPGRSAGADRRSLSCHPDLFPCLWRCRLSRPDGGSPLCGIVLLPHRRSGTRSFRPVGPCLRRADRNHNPFEYPLYKSSAARLSPLFCDTAPARPHPVLQRVSPVHLRW